MEDIDDAQNIGELLRNTRLKKGKTLGDVSKDLCIRKFYLEAIENLETKNLPPLPYGLGFVRSYSDYLGLNSARIVQAFRQAVYAEQSDANEPEIFEENTNTMELGGPKLYHIIIGLVGLVAVFAVWTGMSSPQSSKEFDEETTVDNVVPEPVIIEEEEVSNNESVAETETVASSQTNIDNVSENKTEPVAEIEKTENKASVEVKKTENKVEEEQSSTVTPTRLRIKLAGPSWVELKHNGKVLLSGNYGKDFVYDVPDESGMVISVGRYYNVDFYLDGKLIKVASAMKQTNINLDKYILSE